MNFSFGIKFIDVESQYCLFPERLVSRIKSNSISESDYNNVVIELLSEESISFSSPSLICSSLFFPWGGLKHSNHDEYIHVSVRYALANGWDCIEEEIRFLEIKIHYDDIIAEEVHLTPFSSMDWDLISHNAHIVEDKLLQQTSIVQVGGKFPITIDNINKKCATFIATRVKLVQNHNSLSPSLSYARLARDTLLIIKPPPDAYQENSNQNNRKNKRKKKEEIMDKEVVLLMAHVPLRVMPTSFRYFRYLQS